MTTIAVHPTLHDEPPADAVAMMPPAGHLARSQGLPPLVIYHDRCMDGFAAAWVFHHHARRSAIGRYPEFWAARYGSPPPDVAGRIVYMVDFSYKRAVVQGLLGRALMVTLIDHHATAIEDLAGLAGLNSYTDPGRSGARLAWDYLFPGEPPPPLLLRVEDRDLWRFRLTDTRAVHAGLCSVPLDFAFWDELMGGGRDELTRLAFQGEAIDRKARLDMVALLADGRRRMVIGGFIVPVANVPPQLASDAGHELAKGAPFAATYWDTSDGRKFSLRSRAEGADVSAIAADYGGGGHVHAAGFTVPRDHVLARC